MEISFSLNGKIIESTSLIKKCCSPKSLELLSSKISYKEFNENEIVGSGECNKLYFIMEGQVNCFYGNDILI